MAFFDDIGRKITQVGHNAAEKTRDTADVFKLKGEIANEEDKLNATYLELGKMYYSLHSENFEPQFATLIANAKDAIGRIEACQQQIQDIKKMTVCSKCGAQVPNENRFCTVCGTPRVVNPGDIKCVRCGKVIEAGNKFCIYCGTPAPVPLDQNAQPAAPNSFDDATVSIVPEAVASVTSGSFNPPAAPVVPDMAVPVAPAMPLAPEAPVAPVAPEYSDPFTHEIPMTSFESEDTVTIGVDPVVSPVMQESEINDTAYDAPVNSYVDPFASAGSMHESTYDPTAPYSNTEAEVVEHNNPIPHAIDMNPEV